jgi:hypothetical protein
MGLRREIVAWVIGIPAVIVVARDLYGSERE